MHLDEYFANVRALDIGAMIESILPNLLDYIADLNRWQMGKGLGNDGEYMPSYLNDPYFATKAQAYGYMMYKKKVSPNTQKPVDVMDYYINGYTHNRVEAKNSGDEVIMTANVQWMDKMIANRALGLNDESKSELVRKEVEPRLFYQLREYFGLPN